MKKLTEEDAQALIAGIKTAQHVERLAVLHDIVADPQLPPAARATAQRLILRLDPAGAKTRAKQLIELLGGPESAAPVAQLSAQYLSSALKRDSGVLHYLTIKRLEEEARRRGLI